MRLLVDKMPETPDACVASNKSAIGSYGCNITNELCALWTKGKCRCLRAKNGPPDYEETDDVSV